VAVNNRFVAIVVLEVSDVSAQQLQAVTIQCVQVVAGIVQDVQ
jgi:hypothetical protein